ncbi:MAG: hypothetical protein FD134_2200 [Gallionellaceae bacterium]|nr:MAG: hypothetical protein FD134_2200 [Gallionellaceae bacterium]
MMPAQLRSLLFLGTLFLETLFLGGWPTALMAYAPMQPRQFMEPPPEAGFMLVASRKLADPRFRETVVLVTRNRHSGPIGIVINRPKDITLDKILPAHKGAEKFKLFAGGPVNPENISYLFRGEGSVAGTLKVSGQVYLSYNMSLLAELLSGARAHTGLRVVHGLAAWAPGQLENEIARGDWHVLPVNDEVIFDRPPADIWPELFRKATSTSY